MAILKATRKPQFVSSLIDFQKWKILQQIKNLIATT